MAFGIRRFGPGEGPNFTGMSRYCRRRRRCATMPPVDCSASEPGMSLKTDPELQAAIERAAAALRGHGAREVYVFGSAATGTMREGSDVDLAVSGLPPGVFFRALADAATALGREMDLIDLDDDNLFTRYLKSKGKLLRVA